ncbi:MAG: hypothetical protein EB060_02035 [Proteobacteria bacterium]|nr:hypothetical protein [Pseudomonadota bacterium]
MPTILDPRGVGAAAQSAIDQQMHDWGFEDPENFFYRHTARNALNQIVMRVALLEYTNNLGTLEAMANEIPSPPMTRELANAIETAYKAYDGRNETPLDREVLKPVFAATGTHDCDELEVRVIDYLRSKGAAAALRTIREQPLIQR